VDVVEQDRGVQGIQHAPFAEGGFDGQLPLRVAVEESLPDEMEEVLLDLLLRGVEHMRRFLPVEFGHNGGAPENAPGTTGVRESGAVLPRRPPAAGW
jgi:hypothetical protein